jgi:hypothetical protein
MPLIDKKSTVDWKEAFAVCRSMLKNCTIDRTSVCGVPGFPEEDGKKLALAPSSENYKVEAHLITGIGFLCFHSCSAANKNQRGREFISTH